MKYLIGVINELDQIRAHRIVAIDRRTTDIKDIKDIAILVAKKYSIDTMYLIDGYNKIPFDLSGSAFMNYIAHNAICIYRRKE